MNAKQQTALATLSKAFAKCKKAKLAFVGMDCDLCAFDYDDFCERTKDSSICGQQYKIDGYQGECVNTHGCYMDSGGW